ncbi:MAG: hypothetical protein ACOC16_03605 [Nanoarchaeota archaeon]
MYRVFLLPEFKKKVKKILNKKELKELESFIENKLISRGDKIGKQLTYSFLREKKIVGKRIYYLIYKEIEIILLVGISNKKTQQKTIDEIKLYLPKFKKFAYHLYNKF